MICLLNLHLILILKVFHFTIYFREVKGADTEEKVVFQIIKEAHNKGLNNDHGFVFLEAKIKFQEN